MNLKRSHDPNQRDHPRQTSFIIVEYTVREGTFRDIIKNISANGMFVNTTRTIAEDQSIELRFPLFEFENPIQITGQVTRRTVNGFAVAFDRPIDDLICQEGHFPKIVHEINRGNSS
jgi:hypothetical protein